MMNEAKHEKLNGSEGSLFDVYIPMGMTAENGLSQHRCGQVWGESGTWSSCGR